MSRNAEKVDLPNVTVKGDKADMQTGKKAPDKQGNDEEISFGVEPNGI